jgi:hypothetical protein
MKMYHHFKMTMRDAIIVFCIIVASFFVIGEIGARIFKADLPTMVVASENEKLVYELNKNYEGINVFGMRDRDFNIEDIKDLYRIAVIGDSHAYSLNVKNVEDTFPSQLEMALNYQAGRRIVKILNFGVPGYNTAQELEVLQSRAFMFQPHLVILQYCINDTHVCNYIQPKDKKLNTFIYKSKFLVRLWKNILYSPFGDKYLFEWVSEKLPDALLFQEGLVGTRKSATDEVPVHKPHPPRTKDRVPTRYHYMLGEQHWKRHIQQFAHLSKREGITLLATGFIEEKEKIEFLNEGFDVYSFYEMFQGKNMRDYGYDTDHTQSHFNEEGCYMIGEALGDYIQKHYVTHTR